MVVSLNSIWPWILKVRKIAAWVALFALISILIAQQTLISFYILPWPANVQRPMALDLMIVWRNGSFLLTLLCSIISLPRWQSIIGLVGLLLFLVFLGAQ